VGKKDRPSGACNGRTGAADAQDDVVGGEATDVAGANIAYRSRPRGQGSCGLRGMHVRGETRRVDSGERRGVKVDPCSIRVDPATRNASETTLGGLLHRTSFDWPMLVLSQSYIRHNLA